MYAALAQGESGSEIFSMNSCSRDRSEIFDSMDRSECGSFLSRPRAISTNSSSSDYSCVSDTNEIGSIKESSPPDRNGDVTVLNGERSRKIVSLVEFYFSDDQLLKDVFLLKHVKRNKEGYVSLKLVSSFKKMKSTTKDWTEVAEALKRSEKLELNEEETKVRRKAPLPDHDETVPSRVVLAYNLPFEKPSVADLMSTFAKVGNILAFRIVHPGSISSDVKKYKIKHQALGSTVCAVVEYDTYEAASKAPTVISSSSEEIWNKMQVIHLATKNEVKEEKQTSTKRKKKHRAKNNSASSDSSGYMTSGNQSLSNSDVEQPCGNLTSEVFDRSEESKTKTSSSSRRNSRTYQRQTKSKSYSERNSPPRSDDLLPWLQKRLNPRLNVDRRHSEGTVFNLMTTSETQQREKRRVSSFCIGLPTVKSVKVLRNPLGPDGTSGFRRPRAHLWLSTKSVHLLT